MTWKVAVCLSNEVLESEVKPRVAHGSFLSDQSSQNVPFLWCPHSLIVRQSVGPSPEGGRPEVQHPGPLLPHSFAASHKPILNLDKLPNLPGGFGFSVNEERLPFLER